MNEIYGKAPLNNSANKWGAWWGFGDRHNYQSIYSTANHGPPPCSGPGASAPPSPMVNAALPVVTRFINVSYLTLALLFLNILYILYMNLLQPAADIQPRPHPSVTSQATPVSNTATPTSKSYVRNHAPIIYVTSCDSPSPYGKPGSKVMSKQFSDVSGI